jgi:hypothetical protein
MTGTTIQRAITQPYNSRSLRIPLSRLLLRISNQNLQLLIDHNPDVARGIIKVLCARLRHEDSVAAAAQ